MGFSFFQPERIILMIIVVKSRRYGLLNFVVDAFLTIVTSGLWLIWIFVREMRQRG
jgi:hypothetical protein